jgi:hypothetical protein
MSDLIIIKEHFMNKKIEYPDQLLKGSLKRDICNMTDEDYQFHRYLEKFKDRGHIIHHVEVLIPTLYWIRGLVDHNGKVYVFSVKVDMKEFGRKDFEDLIEVVLLRIKNGEYSE